MLAMSLAELWSQWVGPILQLLIGLGLVIFVHELGHFLIAKRVGIKVERFAIGFGPRLFGIIRAETDYCVNALPLGGYVKMLGQEDFAPLEEGEQADPGSYASKSVGARFAVIAAGVVMNVILAGVLFIIVGVVGKDFPAPVVGGVSPGYPAAEVELTWEKGGVSAPAATKPATTTPPQFGPGLRPGDRVVMLNGTPVEHHGDLQMASALAHADEEFHITVERRDESGQVWTGRGTLGVKPDLDGQLLIFGIARAADVVFDEYKDLITDTPFRKGDRLLNIGKSKIEHHWDIEEIANTLDGSTVTISVERVGEAIDVQMAPAFLTRHDVVYFKDGRSGRIVETRMGADEKVHYLVNSSDGQEIEITRDDAAGGRILEMLDILGMIPRLRVVGVIRGSRADKAEIRPGDIVVGYGDHGAPTFQEFLQINSRVAGKRTHITLLRNGMLVTTDIVPKRRSPERAEVGLINGVDLLHTTVAGVRVGSAAAAAGIVGGDEITKINDTDVATWIDVFNALKDLQGREVTITYRSGEQERTAKIPRCDTSVFDPEHYEIRIFSGDTPFRPLQVRIVKRNPVRAVIWGTRETWNGIIRTYAMLRALLKGTVSTETLSGPLGIGIIGVTVSREGTLVDFVYLMAFISATLAVINFLPIPVVDGGHATFLLIEKVRGRPLPVKIMNIVQFAGLAMIGVALVLLTWQDLLRLLENLW